MATCAVRAHAAIIAIRSYIQAAQNRGKMLSLSDMDQAQGTTETDDFEDGGDDPFGEADDTPATGEDQRARPEGPPVSFDDIGEDHQDIDVYVS